MHGNLNRPIMSCRLIGKDVWPIRPELVSVLQSVSSKLSVAMQATVTTLILPSPLGFTTVRGLGLSEGQHLAGKSDLSHVSEAG